MDDLAALRRRARELGLDRLTDAQLAEFGRAMAAAERHVATVPRAFPPADEPAHVFRMPPRDAGGRGNGR
ncbi:MAG: hypothetical protein JNL07_01815 [Rhodospirillales bacterium]|nr:hypothetical protein [Rhodospirillales bacterium]